MPEQAQPGIAPDTNVAVLERPEPALPWRLRLHDDPVNLVDYVQLALQQVLEIDRAKARTHVEAVERNGSAIVHDGPKDDVEARARALVGYGLDARAETDDGGER